MSNPQTTDSQNTVKITLPAK